MLRAVKEEEQAAGDVDMNSPVTENTAISFWPFAEGTKMKKKDFNMGLLKSIPNAIFVCTDSKILMNLGMVTKGCFPDTDLQSQWTTGCISTVIVLKKIKDTRGKHHISAEPFVTFIKGY